MALSSAALHSASAISAFLCSNRLFASKKSAFNRKLLSSLLKLSIIRSKVSVYSCAKMDNTFNNALINASFGLASNISAYFFINKQSCTTFNILISSFIKLHGT